MTHGVRRPARDRPAAPRLPTLPPMAKNVLGTELKTCSTEPMTGWFRNGCCDTGPGDLGVHTVCVRVTDAFLAFSRERGNDLSSPRPEMQFSGLKAGDRWCVCAPRWVEAMEGGVAPPVILEATHMATLEHVDLDDLKAHALDAPKA